MYYLDLCTSISAIFLPKTQVTSLPGQYQKYLILKILLYLFLKAKSQAEAYRHSFM